MKSFGFIAALVAPLVAASLRLWDCPLRGRAAAPVKCPLCRDIGRVSGFGRAIRSRSDPRLLAIFKHSPSFEEALDARVGLDGDYASFLEAEARFAFRDDEEVVVAFLNRGHSPGVQSAEAWMFNLRGEPMDHFHASRAAHEGGVGATCADPRPELWLLTTPGAGGFTLRRDGRPPRARPARDRRRGVPIRPLPFRGRDVRADPALIRTSAPGRG